MADSAFGASQTATGADYSPQLTLLNLPEQVVVVLGECGAYFGHDIERQRPARNRSNVIADVVDILSADDATRDPFRERREPQGDIRPVRAEFEPHRFHPQPVLFAVLA